MSQPTASDGPQILDGLMDVSRETVERLTIFVGLVEKWQAAQNLVAPDTLPHIWCRHVADSAQIADMLPEARRYVDLGSGAGFPGLVIAICRRDQPGFQMTLVESNRRKAAFLRTVIRETGAPADVLSDRIESVGAAWHEPVDVVTARALAPLDPLLDLSFPFLNPKTVCVFHKGQYFVSELEIATQYWGFDLIEQMSKTDSEGRILTLRNIARRS